VIEVVMDLIERDAHLAVLSDCLADVSTGTGRLVLVSGEAGIGKTSLVAAFAGPQREHLRVLWGICDALFTPRPLGPLHDIAAQLGGSLSQMLASGEDRTAIFSTVFGELQARPTIMVIEDVHWADEGTLDLLRYLGRRISQTTALLLVTYRDDELTLEHPLRITLGDLLTSAATQRILLPPLSEQAVLTLIGDRDLNAAHLHQLTAGNPFFVTEVLDSQAEAIPATLRDAVLARSARLSPAGRSALEAAAVIGGRINLALLEKVTEMDIAGVEECLAGGILLSEEEGLVFRHELARQIILDVISPQRKRTLHQIVLNALAAQPTAGLDLARMAHHAEAIGDSAAVLQYAPPAAHQATSQGAHREAAALYALALRFAHQLAPAEHAALLEAYARECNLTERQAEGIAALRNALEIWMNVGDILKQGHTLAFLAVMLRNHGDLQAAEQASQEAVALLEPLPAGRELALAYRVQSTMQFARRDIETALTLGGKAIAIAESLAEQDVLATAHVAVGSAMLFLDYERGCAYLEQQLAIGRESWHELYVANLLAYLGSCSVELFQLPRAERYLADGITFAYERGLEIFNRFMLAWMAMTCLHTGRWDKASEILSQTSQLPARSVFSRIPTLVATGLLRARRGDPGADSVLDEALALAAPTGSLSSMGMVYAACAEAAWLAGSPEDSRAAAGAAYDLAVSKKHPWLAGELAYWLWQAGEKVPLHDWLAAPYRLQISGDWRRAAETWANLGCPFLQARALAAGDPPAQIRALEIFAQLGARPSAENLRAQLQAAGAVGIPTRPHSSTRENPFGLTNRQLDVLELLIEGLSNAEIATRLHITPKTVDHHVSAVLGKLQVDSRSAAAALARDHPTFQEK
jgi:ATP/maltotriose-dependent transcriptional regulator MalT